MFRIKVRKSCGEVMYEMRFAVKVGKARYL